MKAWIACALLIPVVAGASDRLSYLTVDQDYRYTGLSTVTCKIRVSRLVMTRPYSGIITITWQPPTGDGYSVDYPFEVSPSAPSYSDVSGTASITASMVQSRVLAVAKNPIALSPNDLVSCHAKIDAGTIAAPEVQIYSADMEYTDRS